MAGRVGTFWQPEEVAILLRAAGGSQRCVRLLMGSSHLPNLSCYRRLVSALRDQGYRRSVAQCRSKMKRLKMAFFGARENFQGDPPLRVMPKHYEEMKTLWEAAGRPRWEDRRPEPRRVQQVAAIEEEGRGQGRLRVRPLSSSSEGGEGAARPPSPAQFDPLERSPEVAHTETEVEVATGSEPHREPEEVVTVTSEGSSSGVREHISNAELYKTVRRLGRRVMILERDNRKLSAKVSRLETKVQELRQRLIPTAWSPSSAASEESEQNLPEKEDTAVLVSTD